MLSPPFILCLDTHASASLLPFHHNHRPATCMFGLISRPAALATLVCFLLSISATASAAARPSTRLSAAFARALSSSSSPTSSFSARQRQQRGHPLHQQSPCRFTTTTITTMSAAASSSSTAAPGTAAKKCGLVWYKCSDLRTLDHEPLSLAHAENTNVCHLFCFDPRWFGEAGGPSAPGTLKTGALRARFLLEAVEDLKRRLQDNIVIKLGKPEVEVPRLAKALGVSTVYAHREVTSEELAVVKGVKEGLQKATEGKSKLKEVWGNYLYHINDLPFDNVKQDMPDVFTQFRKAVESKSRVRKYLPTPSPLKPPPSTEAAAAEEAAVNALPSPLTLQALGFTSEEDLAPVVEYGSDARVNPAAVLMFKGGETAGLARVKDYLWEKDLLKIYKDTRNGMLGPDYSSKFSPWLATGSISPRVIFAEITKYERERVENDSTYWLFFELIWRDFFRFSAISFGDAFFKLGGPQANPKKYPWKRDGALFYAWREGRTGYPLVDANMRELKATGFMSNRGRQIVASFFTRDLGLDWRLGAYWFEECLLDYDPCSNYGNWCYAAGVGSDPREDRYFSLPKQGGTYDPDAVYMKHWCPELKEVPADVLINPGRFDEVVRTRYGVDEEVYPRTIVPLKFGGGGGGSKGGGGKGGGGGQGKGGGGSGGGGKARQPFKGPRRPANNRVQSDYF